MEIREIRDSNVREVVSFHNLYRSDNRTVSQWAWEYKGLRPRAFVFSVAVDKGRVVGTQGMIPIKIAIGGDKVLSGKSENSLLDPKYRGGTLWKELYEFAMPLCKSRGMQCIWGYTTTAAKPMKQKIHFSIYEDAICDYALIFNLRATMSNVLRSQDTIIKKLAYSVESIYLYVLSRILRNKSRKKISKTFSIEQKPRSMDDISRLYERLEEKHHHLIYIDQEEEYLMWRIFKNPNVRYRSYFVYEKDLLRSYCFLVTDGKTAHLTDFTYEVDAAGVCLMRILLKALRREKTSSISFFGNRTNSLMASVLTLLKCFGFVRKILFYRSFVLRNLSYKDEKLLYDIRNWYLNGLWTEGYG